eukprot:TRINITY_DN10563_c0_g1_i1.p1 TRINITY_DN10563_c0_g1~~TRINITY_DN10563_c0_g1_i1.p1  ORF type:complete len:708 (-),score=210.24 TRINITY_DN10563_c0_g1_i1:174-2204(-)
MMVTIMATVTIAATPFPTKKLAGPPSEFESLRIPSPQQNALVEKSVTEYVWLTADADAGGFSATLSIPVDGPSEFVWTLASPYADLLNIEMVDPSGLQVDLASALVEGVFPIGFGNNLPISTYEIKDSKVGFYKLSLTAKNLATDMADEIVSSKEGFPHVIVTLVNNDDLRLQSHLQSYEVSVGKTVAVQAQMVDSTKVRADGSFFPLAAQSFSIDDAVLDFLTPDGREAKVPMNDEGLHADLAAGDGVYTGHLTLTKPGQYVAQPTMHGNWAEGQLLDSTPFVRSTQHLIAVSQAEVALTGVASSAHKMDTNRILINLGVDAQTVGDHLRAYTEVYGLDHSGVETAVAWLGGIVEVVDGQIVLELDSNWLIQAGVTAAELILKNTYISDMVTSFPVASYLEDIKLTVTGDAAALFVRDGLSMNHGFTAEAMQVVTEEMRSGVNPLAGLKRAGQKSGLVTVPGYCSAGSPWSPNNADFTDAYHLETESLNISNDEYAQLVLAFADEQGLTSFGLLGHSQGGAVALHIHTFYFSGLDSATGGKKIQSVGTPYQGCTAAGSAADMGNSFGVGCGSNSDLSRDGASVWLASIPSAKRSDVYFYTTTYKRNSFFGDWCSMPMNAVLEWPNDGTTELQFAPLAGGNNMGNTEKQCHTTGMAYGAQYNDHTRNQKISSEAAR